MERYINHNVIKDLHKKMVFVGGPRQVGKTTFAKKLLEGWKGANKTRSMLNVITAGMTTSTGKNFWRDISRLFRA